MSQIEIVFGYTKKIEALLQQAFGADGRGLHTKLNSIEQRLPEALVKKIRWIATIRNNLAHTEGFTIENITDFTKSCDLVIAELEAVAKHSVRLHGSSFGNSQLALQEIVHRNEIPWQNPKERPFSKRHRIHTGNKYGRRLILPLVLGSAAFAWYAHVYDPTLFRKLNEVLHSIVKPKASIEWSRPNAPPQQMEGVNAGKARTSRRIKLETE